MEILPKWTNTIYIIINPGYNLDELLELSKTDVLSNQHTKSDYIVKIGSSKCLPARYYNYKTYSPIATTIKYYYHIKDYDCYQLDDDIKFDLDKYRIHSSGGIEFYYSSILQSLEVYFQSRRIEFTKYIL